MIFVCYPITAVLRWIFMGADFVEPNNFLVVNRFLFHSSGASGINESGKVNRISTHPNILNNNNAAIKLEIYIKKVQKTPLVLPYRNQFSCIKYKY